MLTARSRQACRSPGRLPGLLVLLVCLPAAARGQPLDPAYAERPTAQRDPIARHVRRLVWPVLTAPALVRQGGLLAMLLRWQPGSLPAGRTAWQVSLVRQGRGPARRCPVRDARPAGPGLVELRAEVPAELARDLYDLRVMGPRFDDSQPNAVRIFGADQPESYRFAVVADHQLWDPSYRLGGRELNAGAYPRRDKEAANLALARQGFAELALLDPDFVLHLGDLTFGLDYQREYAEARELLREARLPIFAVPGNHDGYAEYSVKLRGGAARLLSGALGCRRHLEGDLVWGKAWAFARCVYGDIKHLLFLDLRRDGLSYWSRQLGPPAFSFEHGALRFVALNTYDGTPQRRHAFSLYLDAFDLKLGAPAVDNHGGSLGPEQLTFLREQAALARQRGQGLVVLGHHDPRGSQDPPRYHPNQPFPTDPLGLGGFEEWNFDSAAWDSDPSDARPVETAERNSALELLAILAESGGYYLCGHRHQDQRDVYPPGSQLGPYRVKRRLEFVRTTSASGLVREGSYAGYRLIEVRGDRLAAVDYAPGRQLGSVPAGNLWLERRHGKAGQPGELQVHSYLPLATSLVVGWELPPRPEGYRFRALEAGLQPAVLQVLEVGPAGGPALHYRLRLELAGAGAFALTSDRPPLRLVAQPASGNRPPVPRVELTQPGGLPAATAGLLQARVGQPLLLSAERSTDPDGDRIVAHLWDLDGGRSARGPRLMQTFSGPGRRPIALTLVDEAGARSRLVVQVNVEPIAASGGEGCCASSRRRPEQVASGVLPLLLLLLARAAAGRRPRR